MLGHAPFYHQHCKKYVSIFGTLFNEISIIRKDKNGVEKEVKVPLSFGNKDTFLAKVRQDPELSNKWRQVLPRITFEMMSPFYAPERKENTINMKKFSTTEGVSKMQYAPAPYDIPFTLSILTYFYEDGLQIIEQILPFFQPEYTILVSQIEKLGIKKDVHIILDSVDFAGDFEGEFDNERILEWTLTFMVKGFFYGPVESRKLIKRAEVDTFFNPDFEEWAIKDVAEVDPITAEESDPHEINVTRVERDE